MHKLDRYDPSSPFERDCFKLVVRIVDHRVISFLVDLDNMNQDTMITHAPMWYNELRKKLRYGSHVRVCGNPKDNLEGMYGMVMNVYASTSLVRVNGNIKEISNEFLLSSTTYIISSTLNEISSDSEMERFKRFCDNFCELCKKPMC